MLPAFQLVFCDIFWIVRIPFERNVFIEKIHTKQSGDNPGWNRRPREKKSKYNNDYTYDNKADGWFVEKKNGCRGLLFLFNYILFF